MSFTPPPDLKYVRIAGHAYPPTKRHPNGGPFKRDGSEASGDYGFGKCECGVLSPKAYLAKADRNRWHFSHKVEVLSKIKEEFEKDNAGGKQDSGQSQV